MYLLYVDESGSIDDPNSNYLVLAGISVYERQTHWLETHVTNIAARFNPAHPEEVELHAGPMRSGKDGWTGFPAQARVQAVTDVLALLGDPQMKVRVFAAVIEKTLLPVHEIMPHAFEKLATEFDNYLARHYQLSKGRNPQRGIVIFDKSTFEQSIQSLSHVFKHRGHAKGRLRNFAEVPLFLDSKASRLIQVADMVAYWIYRRYAAHDDRGFRLIEPYFENFAGQMQGFHQMVSQATLDAVANIPAPAHPFPVAAPRGGVAGA